MSMLTLDETTVSNSEQRSEADALRIAALAGRRHMRFVLVNGRTPRLESFCVLCSQPIGASYLRETGTQLAYCDHDCYAGHCKRAVLLLEGHARAS